jgi:probable phosphoglycerate mutase
LAGLSFGKVFTSPLQRASRTCELAGFGAVAEIDRHLVEWDYGEYEGLTAAQVLAKRPGWDLFRDGCPGGESPAQVAARADSVVARVRELGVNVLLFSSGHLLRVLAARWLALDSAGGSHFSLGTASLSELSYENHLSAPVIQLWNDTGYLRARYQRVTSIHTQSAKTSV